MAHVLGLDAKLYRNTGTWASPSWNLISNVRDLTFNMEKGEADVSTRAASWRMKARTLKDGSIEFQMVWDTADEDFTAVRDAFLNNTQIEILVLDGAVDVSGSQGLRASCEVASFTRNENLEEALTVDVTLEPGYQSVNVPEWYTVE